jgi:hypothetical protein
MTLTKTTEKLTEARARALWAWPTNQPYIVRDTGVRGLLLRKGLKRITWHFYAETRVGHGQRVFTSKVLGDVSRMTLAEARKAARKIAGRIAADKLDVGAPAKSASILRSFSRSRTSAEFSPVMAPGPLRTADNGVRSL